MRRRLITKLRAANRQLRRERDQARDQVRRAAESVRAFSETATELIKIDRAGGIGWPDVLEERRCHQKD